MHPDVHLFAKALNHAGISAVLAPNEGHRQKVRCLYRNNPDGSIRWIWPGGRQHADFLKFYHVSGTKARILTYALRTIAALGALKLFCNGEFFFYTDTAGADTIENAWCARWSFFTGTVGPNRKGILWNSGADGRGVFSKIALTTRAQMNLALEAGAIGKAKAIQLTKIDIPDAELRSESCLRLSDLGNDSVRSNNWRDLPQAAAIEWLQADIAVQPLPETDFLAQVQVRLGHIAAMNDPRIPAQLPERLQALRHRTEQSADLATTVAHGDFTPWNVLIKKDRLAIIDWELAQDRLPALYDLFHFVYQSNILVKRSGYRSIRAELDAALGSEPIAGMLRENGIDAQLYESCYLLWTLSYYLELYSMQPQWHMQVSWLLHTWGEALAWQLRHDLSPRQLLLQDLSPLLNDVRHAVLKWRYGALECLPETSDIDICVDRAAIPGLLEALRRHPLVTTVEVRRRSFMDAAAITLTDGSLLHLDLIHTFKRKHLVFLSAGEVLARAVKSPHGFSTAAPADDFLYTVLFYGLNGQPVPAHYRDHFGRAAADVQHQMVTTLRSSFLPEAVTIDDAWDPAPRRREACIAGLRAALPNRGLRGMLNRCRYVLDTARDMCQRKGFIVTFSGVDGAGKSTVIEEVRRLIDKGLRRKVVVLRHRPSLLPILSAWKHGKEKASSMSAERLPRQGTNRSPVSSLLRFGYYYADYLIGQFYIQLRYVRRGYVVVYDRYYFDFIHDGVRSNIRLPKPFVRAGFRLLLKPALNFFLYADADTIYKRKQELDPGTIRQLTQDYLQHFESLGKRRSSARYIPVENDSLPQTIQTIFQHIKQRSA